MLQTVISIFQYKSIFCGLTPVANCGPDQATLNHPSTKTHGIPRVIFIPLISLRVFTERKLATSRNLPRHWKVFSGYLGLLPVCFNLCCPNSLRHRTAHKHLPTAHRVKLKGVPLC